METKQLIKKMYKLKPIWSCSVFEFRKRQDDYLEQIKKQNVLDVDTFKEDEVMLIEKEDIDPQQVMDIYDLIKIDGFVFYTNTTIVRYMDQYFDYTKRDEFIHIPNITLTFANFMELHSLLKIRDYIPKNMTLQQFFLKDYVLQTTPMLDDVLYIKWNLEYIKEGNKVKPSYYQYVIQFNEFLDFGCATINLNIPIQDFEHQFYGRKRNEYFIKFVQKQKTHQQLYNEIEKLIKKTKEVVVINLRVAPPDLLLLHLYKQLFKNIKYQYYDCVGPIVRGKGGMSEVYHGGPLYKVDTKHKVLVQPINKNEFIVKVPQGAVIYHFYYKKETYYYVTEHEAYLLEPDKHIIYDCFQNVNHRGLDDAYTFTQALLKWHFVKEKDGWYQVENDLTDLNFWQTSFYNAISNIIALTKSTPDNAALPPRQFTRSGVSKIKEYVDYVKTTYVQDYYIRFYKASNEIGKIRESEELTTPFY